MANTLYEGYNFTEEDFLRFDTYGMDVQNAIDQGFSQEEISLAAKELEQDELFKQERAQHPVQQSRPVAPTPEVAPPKTDFFDVNTTVGDLTKTFGSTLSNLVGSTVGFGLERWGESINNQALYETGKYIKDRANEMSADLNESMTAGGKSDSIGSRDLLKFDKPDDIIPSGLGDANLGTILQLIAGGAASTLPILGVGGKVASGLSKIPGVSTKVAGGLGYGATAGGFEGMSTASDVFDDAMRVTDAEIVQSPIFAEMQKIVLAKYPDAQGSQLVDFTRKQIAKQASWEAGTGSGALIAATSWPIGGLLGRLRLGEKGAKDVYKKGMISSMYSGGWREGAQEFFQEGGQQIAQNYGKYLTGQNPDAISFEGFTEAGVRGLVPGTALGGTTAAIYDAGLDTKPVAPPPEEVVEEGVRLEEEEDLIDTIDQPTPQDSTSPAQKSSTPPVVTAPTETEPVGEEEDLAEIDKMLAEDDIIIPDDDTKTDVQLGLPPETETTPPVVTVPTETEPVEETTFADEALEAAENIAKDTQETDVPLEDVLEEIDKGEESVRDKEIREEIKTAKWIRLKDLALEAGVTKEEIEEIRLGDPKKYRDKETGLVTVGKDKALRKLIEGKLGTVAPAPVEPIEEAAPTTTPVAEPVAEKDAPRKPETTTPAPIVAQEETPVAEEDDPTMPVDIDEADIGKPVATAPTPIVAPEETATEEVSQALVDAIVLVDTYGSKPEDLRDQKKMNVGEMRSLAKELGIKVKANETKFNTAKKLAKHVKDNRPESEIKKSSLTGRVDIGKARADIVDEVKDVDTKIAEAIARAGDTDVPVSLELRTKIQRRIRELEKKEEAGTITDQERKNLAVHKKSKDFYEKRVSREFANNPEGLKKEVKKLKKAAKKKLDNLWITHRPAIGLSDLLSDPKTRDTAYEWLEAEVMSAKLSHTMTRLGPSKPGVTDTSNITIQKITPDEIAMKELEKAYERRDVAIANLNKRRNKEAARLEKELSDYRVGQYRKVDNKKITKDKANHNIKVKEGQLARTMEKFVAKLVVQVPAIEENFYKLAEKYEFDPKGFKPQLIEDATLEDLEEATDVVKEAKRQFTETMNALYHSDGTYVGPTGGFIKTGNKNLLSDDESKAVEQIMADQGFAIGDEFTSEELLELRNRMNEEEETEESVPTGKLKGKSPMRKSQEEDPSLMESYPTGTGLQGWRIRALQDWVDSLQGKKRKLGKKTKAKVKFKPKMYESPFKKSKGVGSRDRKGRIDTGLDLQNKLMDRPFDPTDPVVMNYRAVEKKLQKAQKQAQQKKVDKLQEELDLLHKDLIARFPVEKGSVEEAKQAVFKRPVQSTGNPIKLVVQEENNVMNIEIIAQDGSLDGVWIGALTLELLPDSATSKDNMKQLQSVFNKSAMIKYGISLEDIDLITAQSLGATVFSTKAHDLPGSYFMRHEKVRQMLNPKQQGYFDDIPFFAGDYEISEEEEAALDAHLEQLKKKKRPKVKEEFKPVDVELGDIFKDETVEKEGPVDRGDAGEEVDVDETVEEAKAAAKEKKRQRAAQKEIDIWNKQSGKLGKQQKAITKKLTKAQEKAEKSKEEEDLQAVDELKLELDLIDQLMGADFDETVAQGNPDNVTKKVVDNSHDNVADENLNCFKI